MHNLETKTLTVHDSAHITKLYVEDINIANTKEKKDTKLDSASHNYTSLVARPDSMTSNLRVKALKDGCGIKFSTFDDFICIKSNILNKNAKDCKYLFDSSTQQIKALKCGSNIEIKDEGENLKVSVVGLPSPIQANEDGNFCLLKNNILKNIKNGENINIKEDEKTITISAILPYSAGSGISISNNVIRSQLLKNASLKYFQLLNTSYTLKSLNFSDRFLITSDEEKIDISLKKSEVYTPKSYNVGAKIFDSENTFKNLRGDERIDLIELDKCIKICYVGNFCKDVSNVLQSKTLSLYTENNKLFIEQPPIQKLISIGKGKKILTLDGSKIRSVSTTGICSITETTEEINLHVPDVSITNMDTHQKTNILTDRKLKSINGSKFINVNSYDKFLRVDLAIDFRSGLQIFNYKDETLETLNIEAGKSISFTTSGNSLVIDSRLQNYNENDTTKILTDDYKLKSIKAGKGIVINNRIGHLEIESSVISSHCLKGDKIMENDRIKTLVAGCGVNISSDLDSVTISVKNMQALLNKIETLEYRLEKLEKASN